MSATRQQQLMSSWGDAIDRLEEALAWSGDEELNRDATILRFTFVYELAWRAMKWLLSYEGIETTSPREALRQAYQAHWIDNEPTWLKMIQDRNLVTHTYNRQTAVGVHERIKGYAPVFQNAHTFLKEKFADILKE